MIPIPPAIETLIQSKVMVGENRPTAYIEIDGEPPSQDLTDPTVWTIWRNFTSSGHPYGNIAETNDGRAIAAYAQNGDIYIAYAPTVVGILNGTETFDYGSAIKIFENAAADWAGCSINMIDGVLYLAVSYCVENYYPAGPWPNFDGAWVDVYKDTDGNGTGFTKIGTPRNALRVQKSSWQPSFVQKLGNGTLVVGCAYGYDFGHEGKMYRSSDGGINWNSIDVPTGYYLGCHVGMRYLQDGDDSFYHTQIHTNGTHFICYYYNSGANASTYSWDAGWPSWDPELASWEIVDDQVYMAEQNPAYMEVRIWQKNDPSDLSPTSIKDPDSWTLITTLSADALAGDLALTLASEALILQHTTSNLISGAGTLVSAARPLPVISITNNQSKGSCAQVTIEIDNADGYYSPYNYGSDWYQVIMTNKVVRVYMGYGSEMQKIFTGMIDKVDQKAWPGRIIISARDMYKLAIDQLCRVWDVDHYSYILTYTNQELADIFTDLALKAGWAAGEINATPTGIIIPEITFTHQSYADAFQRLNEIAGYESFADYEGEIFYQPAVDPEPSASQVFTEGRDIFSLDLSIDDLDLYRTVVIYSTDKTTGEFIRLDGDWTAADNYNLPEGKVLIIDATDLASDLTQLATLLQQALDSMNSKPIEVNFIIVGNPYVQLSDPIQVIETITTISEVYRIYELEHKIQAQGSPIFSTQLRCYHFAYAPIPT